MSAFENLDSQVKRSYERSLFEEAAREAGAKVRENDLPGSWLESRYK
jgi:hypothetical protein